MENPVPYLKLLRGDPRLPLFKTLFVFLKIGTRSLFCRNTWEGIYPDAKSLPLKKDNEFDNPEWLYPLYLSTKKVIQDMENERPIRKKSQHGHLAALAGPLRDLAVGVMGASSSGEATL